MSTVPEETGATPELDRLMRKQAEAARKFVDLYFEARRQQWMGMLEPKPFPRPLDFSVTLRFGLMLEKSNSPEWAHSPWRVYSARIHGPMCATRRDAFWQWFKNWLTTFKQK